MVGFKRSVVHLDGHVVTLKKSTVTSPGEVMRVAGEGMPVHNYASKTGDLFVKFTVDFPTALTPQQKEGAALPVPSPVLLCSPAAAVHSNWLCVVMGRSVRQSAVVWNLGRPSLCCEQSSPLCFPSALGLANLAPSLSLSAFYTSFAAFMYAQISSDAGAPAPQTPQQRRASERGGAQGIEKRAVMAHFQDKAQCSTFRSGACGRSTAHRWCSFHARGSCKRKGPGAGTSEPGKEGGCM